MGGTRATTTARTRRVSSARPSRSSASDRSGRPPAPHRRAHARRALRRRAVCRRQPRAGAHLPCRAPARLDVLERLLPRRAERSLMGCRAYSRTTRRTTFFQWPRHTLGRPRRSSEATSPPACPPAPPPGQHPSPTSRGRPSCDSSVRSSGRISGPSPPSSEATIIMAFEYNTEGGGGGALKSRA